VAYLARGSRYPPATTRVTCDNFGRTVASNGSLYATGPLSCLSVTLMYCGQTAGWIKMPLGTEVSLGPGHIMLDGDPAPPPHRDIAAPPSLFGLCLLWPNGWMDQDTTWYGGRPLSRRYCVRWRPSSSPRKGAQQPPLFGPWLLLPSSRPSQQLLSSCYESYKKI